MHKYHYQGLLLGVGIAFLLTLFLLITPTMHQDLQYHKFADSHSLYGISNFANVISNVVFLIVGIAAIFVLRRPHLSFHNHVERWIYLIFFIGIVLVGLGSAYYHLHPTNSTLVWDRLPITISLMSLVSALISERVDSRAGLWSVGPLIIIGITSAVHWHFNDDLRLYGFVIFSPYLVIPLLFWLYPTTHTRSSFILYALLWTVIARVCEYYDEGIYHLTAQMVSGHTLKHVFMALAALLILQYVTKRQQ